MKIVIILLLVGCATSLAKVCRCDHLSSFYNTIGCKPICRRGNCVTRYSCNNLKRTFNSQQQSCYFKGKFYPIGHQLPVPYPKSNTDEMCNYTCTFEYNMYDFETNECAPYTEIPSRELCEDMYRLMVPFITKWWYALKFEPEICNVQASSPMIALPPGNCSGRKCCVLTDKKYKVGTVIIDRHLKYECICPPLMSLDITE